MILWAQNILSLRRTTIGTRWVLPLVRHAAIGGWIVTRFR